MVRRRSSESPFFRAAGYDDPNIRVAIEPEALHGLKKQVQNLE
jgi:hypothetical protein